MLDGAQRIECAVVGKALAQRGDAAGLPHQIIDGRRGAVNGRCIQQHRAGQAIGAGFAHGVQLRVLAGGRIEQEIQAAIGARLGGGLQRRVEQARARERAGLLVHANASARQGVERVLRLGAQAINRAVEHRLQLRVRAALREHVKRAEGAPQLFRSPVL